MPQSLGEVSAWRLHCDFGLPRFPRRFGVWGVTARSSHGRSGACAPPCRQIPPEKYREELCGLVRLADQGCTVKSTMKAFMVLKHLRW